MGLRAGLGVLEKSFCRHRDMNPDRPARSLVAIPTEIQYIPVEKKGIFILRVSRVCNSRFHRFTWGGGGTPRPRIKIHLWGPSLDRRIKIFGYLVQICEPYRAVFKELKEEQKNKQFPPQCFCKGGKKH